ncbi:hypothetical protein E2C01_056219 [Portunus trituberculatus]|uniref:Uncharacterized protein n=1 Tax=Portunus trituberculatus TaxID=210409 RepID=A0A5B7GWZ6_PORTR|nr:hypothetical protein [Portunus trituberculatus]
MGGIYFHAGFTISGKSVETPQMAGFKWQTLTRNLLTEAVPYSQIIVVAESSSSARSVWKGCGM